MKSIRVAQLLLLSLAVGQSLAACGTLSTSGKQLIEATKNKHPTEVSQLLNKGVDPNTCDEDGNPALHWAAWYGYVDIVQILLDGGANTETRDKDTWTPLHTAVRSDKSNADTVDTLLNGGANVNALDKYQWTPLHWAAYYDRVEDAKVLLRHGADTTLRGYQGRTPLEVAEYNNKPGVAQLLSH